jgi:cation diffusion facilitator family transporter
MAGDVSHVYQSLFGNLAIAVSKGLAAYISGSGALLAETIHSFSDCGNQLLLLVGIRRSARPPDAAHPLGYGRSLYFWSFMVAIMLLLGGGVFSVYEGVVHYRHPEALGSLTLGIATLLFAFLVEGWATWANLKEMKKRRKDMPLLQYLRATKDSDLVVVFGENAAATVGGGLALAAVVAAQVTGDTRWDALGSVCVGVVLLLVAVFLANEIQSLLLGEAADPEVAAAVAAAAAEDKRIAGIHQLIAVQEGPGVALVAMKLSCDEKITVGELHELIQAFEVRLRKLCPTAKWVFVEPDLGPDSR